MLSDTPVVAATSSTEHPKKKRKSTASACDRFNLRIIRLTSLEHSTSETALGASIDGGRDAWL